MLSIKPLPTTRADLHRYRVCRRPGVGLFSRACANVADSAALTGPGSASTVTGDDNDTSDTKDSKRPTRFVSLEADCGLLRRVDRN